MQFTITTNIPSVECAGSFCHGNWTPVQTAPYPPQSTRLGTEWNLANLPEPFQSCVYARITCQVPAYDSNHSMNIIHWHSHLFQMHHSSLQALLTTFHHYIRVPCILYTIHGISIYCIGTICGDNLTPEWLDLSCQEHRTTRFHHHFLTPATFSTLP